MRSDEHYRLAEALLANLRDEMAGSPGTLLRTPEQRAEMREEALAHATLAHAAVLAESATSAQTGFPLVSRPFPAADGDPAYPGSPWGRALYGDLHTTNDKDS